ncbi:MAG: hypothetical protein ACRCUA_00575 [Fusobacteriaceae bacterium]
MNMFFLGFAAGIAVLLLVLGIYLWMIEKSNKRNFEKILKNEYDQEQVDEEVKEIVLNTKKKVLSFHNIGFENNLKILQEASIEMAMEISKKYNPDSKYPHLELTFYELLKLNSDITQFFLENLEKKYFMHLKKVKVCHLLNLNDAREKHFPTFEKIGKLSSLVKFFMNPVGAAIKTAGTSILIPVGLEALFKISGNYGVEELGKELNLIYSGYYSKKEKKDI